MFSAMEEEAGDISKCLPDSVTTPSGLAAWLHSLIVVVVQVPVRGERHSLRDYPWRSSPQ